MKGVFIREGAFIRINMVGVFQASLNLGSCIFFLKIAIDHLLSAAIHSKLVNRKKAVTIQPDQVK